ncbi:hypothetical protein TNCV_178361 [Trichonephila clavipes]|nr:hypothetical protein TNCV_178361 [Trichonephila clavipes]
MKDNCSDLKKIIETIFFPSDYVFLLLNIDLIRSLFLPKVPDDGTVLLPDRSRGQLQRRRVPQLQPRPQPRPVHVLGPEKDARSLHRARAVVWWEAPPYQMSCGIKVRHGWRDVGIQNGFIWVKQNKSNGPHTCGQETSSGTPLSEFQSAPLDSNHPNNPRFFSIALNSVEGNIMLSVIWIGIFCCMLRRTMLQSSVACNSEENNSSSRLGSNLPMEHIKCVGPHINVVWKFGQLDAISDVSSLVESSKRWSSIAMALLHSATLIDNPAD